MDRMLLAGIVVLCALSAGGLASAQTPTVNSVQKDFPAQPQAQGATKVPDGTVPPPPHAQPEAPLGDLAKPAAVGPAQTNTADRVQGETPPGATPQTMPSTMSEQNAIRDKLPTGALQLPLTDDKRQVIADNMYALPDTSGSDAVSDLDVTGFLPADVPMQSFPVDLVRQVPETRPYKYVKRSGVVYIIDPPNMTVVGEIHL